MLDFAIFEIGSLGEKNSHQSPTLQLEIDVTNINDCNLGDWCEFFSKDLSISNIAKSNDLISYYLMTGVKSRVKKVYKRAD